MKGGNIMEEKNNEEKGDEESKEDSGDGDESEIVKQTRLANEAAERMEKATAENEKSIAKARVAGVTEAGKEPEKKVVETPKEYAERMEKGL